MPNIESRISPLCLELLKATILEAGGNEVFFLAKPDRPASDR